MAEEILASVQVRRDSKANWESVNPILLNGEAAYEQDTDMFKIGDGVKRYSDLPYHNKVGPQGPQGEPGPTPQISMNVSTSNPGTSASVSVTGTAENPVINLTVPRGDTGKTGSTGPKGDTGSSGVYIGTSQPTDSNINVWIDSDGEPTEVIDDFAREEIGRLKSEIPTTLPNPQPITINGQRYDGSEAVTVTVSSEGGGTPVEIDDTLTQSGKAADAKAVGDQLSALNEANATQDERLSTLEQAGGIVTVEPAQDDVPLLFYSAALPQTKTDTAMPISYMSKTLKREDADAKTKAQGNSSLSYAKKNQTTKFSQAFNFKGWGLQKKYCMKANWIDLTHARNIVSAQLWGDVVKSRANYLDLPELLRTSPNQGAIDGFPALVYADGVYQGRYTINIPKDGWMANMDKTLDTHCILCGENYVSGCFRAAANINGSDWSDELHDTVPDAIKTRWNEVISFVMNSTDEEFKANLGNYFYVDSLIDYDLFALASCGLDSMGKNQIYMTYDGQKWIASMYDMDSTWGLYWNGSSFVASDYARTSYEDYVSGRNGNLLYIRLEQNFHAEIQARWAELKAGPLSYANIMTRFERFIGIVPPHIVKEDYASTTGGGSFTGIPSQSTNNIQQIRAFAAARLEWTDEYVAALTPAEEIPCTGITLDQTTLTFTAAGTQTLTATVTPSDTTDTVVWSSDAPSIASVSNGVVTAIANGSATITATCGAYSAICAVTVSGIETGGDTPSEGILYQLAEPMTFNGTSDYIDTGVKLFDTQKDFTLILEGVDYADLYSGGTISIAHCMKEGDNRYPGLSIAKYNDTRFSTQISQSIKIEKNWNPVSDAFKCVVRVSGDAGSVSMCDSFNIFNPIYNSGLVYTPHDKTLVLGAYQDDSLTKGRFWPGMLNRCIVYGRALSDEEIVAYLISNIEAHLVVWSDTPEWSIASSGLIVKGHNYVTLYPIAVPASATIEMSNNGGSYNWFGVAQYKSDMTLISYSESGSTTNAYTVVLDDKAKYVKLSAYNNSVESNNNPNEQINVSISEPA